MALDEALLDAVDADPSAAILRTYEWEEPTLSLGYFQGIADVDLDPRWQGAPVIRRPSGGGALWHDREITYALVVPRRHPLAGRPANLYRAVHAAIAGILREHGIPAATRGSSLSDSSRSRPFLCFLDRDPEDILVGMAKVVGSAQRRRPGAVLQHGSLLLARSDRTPELPGLKELTGDHDSVRGAGWAEAIRAGLPGALGMIAHPDTLTIEEGHRASGLEANVYRNATWLTRR
ncbi:MAG: lipoate-protein ligase [Planctomycetota bacterium]|nr:lipoate-protein ligase [Planctomycetota bacterium]